MSDRTGKKWLAQRRAETDRCLRQLAALDDETRSQVFRTLRSMLKVDPKAQNIVAHFAIEFWDYDMGRVEESRRYLQSRLDEYGWDKMLHLISKEGNR
jgi:hypothetical protein